MYRLQVKDHFDAAHYIRDYQGKCSRMHGHRWDVEVVVEGSRLNELNMLVDFSEVKSMLKKLIDLRLDHHVLNERLSEPNVTAEFLSRWFYVWLFNPIAQIRSEDPIRLVRVTVWEGPDCCASYV